MRTAVVVLILGATIGGTFLISHFLSSTYVRLPFSRVGTLTLRTTSIPVLPPHTHETTDARADSILAPGHGVIVESEVYTVPEDLWITGIEVLTDNAPHSVLHHLILANDDEPSETCPDRKKELYTVGADAKEENAFPPPFGIFLKKGEHLILSGMVHNPLPPAGEGGTYHNVSIGYRFTVERPGAQRTRPVEFQRLTLENAPYCKDQDLYGVVDVFTVPPHTETFVRSSDTTLGVNPSRYEFKEAGILMGFGGHLHEAEGGKRVDLYLNDSLLGSFIPEWIPPHPWTWNMTPHNIAPHPVVAGDVLTLSATYENNRNVPIEDAMGQAVIFFAPERTSN
jgi:hypothetical protein